MSPFLRLIRLNKVEIERHTNKIKIFFLPCEDCLSVFLPSTQVQMKSKHIQGNNYMQGPTHTNTLNGSVSYHREGSMC